MHNELLGIIAFCDFANEANNNNVNVAVSLTENKKSGGVVPYFSSSDSFFEKSVLCVNSILTSGCNYKVIRDVDSHEPSSVLSKIWQ